MHMQPVGKSLVPDKDMNTSRRNTILWQLLLPLAAAPLIWWIFDATPLDRWMIGWYYDVGARNFPLRDDVFMQNVMHNGLKLIVVAVGMILAGAYLLSFLLPQLAPQRRRLLWLLGGMCGATALVAVLKHYSVMHCPWDLADYGGYAAFHGLFDSLPANTAPGRCFPSGHASGGFALLAFYFGLRDSDADRARLMLFLGLALGLVMGWAQMMRGAHFLSHTVWAAWVEWMFLALLYHLVPPHLPVPAAEIAQGNL
ncbi:phosphatase PAP2 family protein [Herbaspirillum sp. HC18]|nr:phosphatase PAP2 family protein [Herbaspirillum sp. HC18]